MTWHFWVFLFSFLFFLVAVVGSRVYKDWGEKQLLFAGVAILLLVLVASHVFFRGIWL